MKKLFALLLSVVMVLSLVTVALGDTTGSITVTNAQQGKTYSAYKIFDATYDEGTDAVSYTIPATKTAILAAIKAEGSPFKVAANPDANGNYLVQSNGTMGGADTRDWVKENLLDEHLLTCSGTKKCESGNTATITGLEPGYYYVISDDLDAIASLDTNTPNVEILDKMDTTPKNPTKHTDTETADIGEEINYTLTLDTTNFVTFTDGGVTTTKQITHYIMKDTVSKGIGDGGSEIADLTMNGFCTIEVYASKEAYEGGQNPIDTLDPPTYDQEEGSFTGGDFRPYNGNDQLQIDWATQNADGTTYTSKYPSPAFLVITYTNTLQSSVAADGSAVNTVHFSYLTTDDDEPEDVPGDNPSETVYSFSVDVNKIAKENNTSKKLTGAKFTLQNADGKYYTYKDRENTSGVGVGSDKIVEWVTLPEKPDEGDEEYEAKEAAYEAALNAIYFTANDEVEFKGIKAGTYTLTEVVAPDGYNLPEKPWVVTITKGGTETAPTFSATIKVQGSSSTTNLNQSGSLVNTFKADIENTKGVALPTTGGAGTIAMISVGAVLFVGMALVLITKKRLYNEG